MTFDEIIRGIKDLAHSQGFYGRLLEEIFSLDPQSFETLKINWEAQDFKDIVDFVMYIEG